jgi:hypothetical protein
MKEIKTLLPEELIESLSAEAKEKGMHRSELIRERLMQPPNHLGLTTNDFHKAVTKVRRRSSYGWGLKTFICITARSLTNTVR